jgi:hypothetical protein
VRQQAESANFVPIEVELLEPVNLQQWQADFIAQAKPVSNTTLMLFAKNNEDIRPKIFNFVVQNHWTLLEMKQHQKPLEEVFRQLTK